MHVRYPLLVFLLTAAADVPAFAAEPAGPSASESAATQAVAAPAPKVMPFNPYHSRSGRA